MNPIYKVAWIIPILLFPVFGGLFYIFFAGKKLHKRAKHKMTLIGDKMSDVLQPKEDILEEIENQSKVAANQSRYIQDYAYSPPDCNTTTDYFPIGEMKFEQLKEELKKAEDYIFLEYFIIEEGEMWNSILDILVEKAAEGVDVRVIYDDVGCLFTLPYKYNEQLEMKGIKCSVFNPLVPVLSPVLNNRDHRKIIVIDGHTGFTGGINLADEYINSFEKYGHWKDSAIMLKGEAVWSMTVMFLSMWDYLRGIKEDLQEFKPNYNLVADNSKDGTGYIQPFADNPLDGETVGQIVYLNLINKAQDYVYIMTPYLIIDNEMATALSAAAKGGVDVRIITPHCADKWYVHAVTRSYYRILIENGVKIYEYRPGFVHAKSCVVDDEYGVVSTINMDYRSLYLHFECGVWMYDCSSIIEMKDDFFNTLKFCSKITIKELEDTAWYKELGRSVLRVFAPLM
ncbi:cardiolipin synthase [Natroniella sulfidigena]|nr:cardiolipin synthase [Natroniella sulfidigena]